MNKTLMIASALMIGAFSSVAAQPSSSVLQSLPAEVQKDIEETLTSCRDREGSSDPVTLDDQGLLQFTLGGSCRWCGCAGASGCIGIVPSPWGMGLEPVGRSHHGEGAGLGCDFEGGPVWGAEASAVTSAGEVDDVGEGAVGIPHAPHGRVLGIGRDAIAGCMAAEVEAAVFPVQVLVSVHSGLLRPSLPGCGGLAAFARSWRGQWLKKGYRVKPNFTLGR